MPQGGVDPGENLELAAKRELLEEIGSSNIEILKISDQTIRYKLPAELRQKLWNGEYAGQEQFWIAARFLGQNSDIDIKHHALPEFRNWKWVPLDETLNLIVPFKRDVYKQVISMFSEFAT